MGSLERHCITVMPEMGSESDPHGPGEVCIPVVMPSEM